MMKRVLCLLVLMVSLASSGCSTGGKTLVSKFNPAEAQAALEPGDNSISGVAFTQRSDGKKVPSGMFPVTLTPVTAYSSERIQYLFNNTQQGYSAYLPAKFSNEDPLFRTQGGKNTKADPSCDGAFIFDHLKDGEYFIVAFIPWKTAKPDRLEFGSLMQRVRVMGGEKKEIILSHSE